MFTGTTAAAVAAAAAVLSPALGGHAPHYRWTQSLTFSASAAPGVPAPNMGMNIVAHGGRLYLGTSTNSEPRRYSGRESYVYRKDSASAPWQLDATFEPATERIGAMESVLFARAGDGRPLPGGPVTILVAATNQNRTATPKPVQARIRIDSTGRWVSVPVSRDTLPVSQVREIAAHRDSVTHADMVFIAASPAPLGIYSGAYDATAPGHIKWNPTPEVRASSDRATQKWFGMDTVNGTLYASNNTGIFARTDGPHPSWHQVASASDTGLNAQHNPEFRGLTVVPDPRSITGWPERQMLLFSYGNAMWRMRAGGHHTIKLEYNLRSTLEQQLHMPVPLAEAAFNRLNPVTEANGTKSWLIGFQFYNSQLGRVDPHALFLRRDERMHYAIDQISPVKGIHHDLLLARDIAPSPFPHQRGIVYATGYNASAATDKPFLGRAWVARGTPK